MASHLAEICLLVLLTFLLAFLRVRHQRRQEWQVYIRQHLPADAFSVCLSHGANMVQTSSTFHSHECFLYHVTPDVPGRRHRDQLGMQGDSILAHGMHPLRRCAVYPSGCARKVLHYPTLGGLCQHCALATTNSQRWALLPFAMQNQRKPARAFAARRRWRGQSQGGAS